VEELAGKLDGTLLQAHETIRIAEETKLRLKRYKDAKGVPCTFKFDEDTGSGELFPDTDDEGDDLVYFNEDEGDSEGEKAD